MILHKLKTQAVFFEKVWDGKKNFEIRKNDRNYQVGDTVRLKEYNKNTDKYSGRIVKAEILYITDYGQCEGFVVFAMGNITKCGWST